MDILSRVLHVCLVIAAAVTAQQQPYQAGGLIFWVPIFRQLPSTTYPININNGGFVAKATQITNRDSISVSAPPSSYASSNEADVITHGLHLGNTVDHQSSDDTPPSIITHGPHPGAYTAVSSNEQEEATQFHSQDGRGQFLFGHSSPDQARLESRSADGTVRGSYSYIDPQGRTVKVSYIAGENGFQAIDDSPDGSYVLPKPVTDTPEVKAARALHARLYDRARWLAESSPDDGEEEVKPGVQYVPSSPPQYEPVPPPQFNPDLYPQYEPPQSSPVQPPQSYPQYEPPQSYPPQSYPVQPPRGEPPQQNPPSSSVPVSIGEDGDDADHYHQPDSLYVDMGSTADKDEELKYYGAAKGKPLPYTAELASKTAHHGYYGAGNLDGKPLAYTGAYRFPGIPYFSMPSLSRAPLLSPYSVPSLHEQQNLHRVSPGIGNEPHPDTEIISTRTNSDSYKGTDNLEYYGAAKLLSLVNQIQTPSQLLSRRGGKSLDVAETPAQLDTKTPESNDDTVVVQALPEPIPAATVKEVKLEEIVPVKKDEVEVVKSVEQKSAHEPRFSTYQQASPVFVAVGVAQDQQHQPQDLPSLRTVLNEPQQKQQQQQPSPAKPIIPPASLSQKAAFFGAVPVAAVHDAQVAPGQSVKNHQVLPIYIESN